MARAPRPPRRQQQPRAAARDQQDRQPPRARALPPAPTPRAAKNPGGSGGPITKHNRAQAAKPLDCTQATPSRFTRVDVSSGGAEPFIYANSSAVASTPRSASRSAPRTCARSATRCARWAKGPRPRRRVRCETRQPTSSHQRFLAANGIEIAGIESSRPQRPHLRRQHQHQLQQRRRGAGRYGMRAIASFLGRELKALYNPPLSIAKPR